MKTRPDVILLILLSYSVTASSCLKIADRECLDQAPDVITEQASFVIYDSAILNGLVSAHGQSTIVSFEYGTTDAYGQKVDIFKYPVAEVSYRPVNVRVSGLMPETTYHFRLNAKGECKEAFGEDMTFTTLRNFDTGIRFNPGLAYGSVSDIDGNVYNTITIGSQTWMAENLRTERLNDALGIMNDINNHTWTSRTDPAYSRYDNSVLIKFSTGNLYNWYAVNTGKLCPLGWHVPSETEWNTLILNLGGDATAGIKLKQSGTTLWPASNEGATNESGFTAIPAGMRIGSIGGTGGLFADMGVRGYWWTSTQSSPSTAKYRSIDGKGLISGIPVNPGKYELNNKNFGFSVRCIKD